MVRVAPFLTHGVEVRKKTRMFKLVVLKAEERYRKR